MQGISKTYHDRGDALPVLSGVEFELGFSSLDALCGPSGSGKTTLLNIIAGLSQPDEGQVLLEGKKIDDLGRSLTSRLRTDLVGIVFQNPNLMSYLDSYENVLFPAVIAGRCTEENRRYAASLLSRLGLASRKTTFPAKLSEGEKRRVSFARGMVTKPKLILADEPMANLDAENCGTIKDILEEAKEAGQSILISTHDEDVSAWADRTLRISCGKLL